MGIKVKLNHVRLAFPVLWKAEQYQGQGAFRYSAVFLVEPGSANDTAIWDAIKSECVRVWDKRATVMLDSIRGNANKFCYQPGDAKGYDGYVGMMALAAHRKQETGRPKVVDKNYRIELTPEDAKPYSGCYVNGSVEIYAQVGQNNGMRASLLGVQFAGDGDAFTGGSKPSIDDFEDISDGTDASADFA